jgi:hypothetical protein
MPQIAGGTTNGRPWFVAYNKYAVGALHVGTLFVPFQPSNEAEELYLQSLPFVYREFPTELAAQAWLTSMAGKKAQALNHVIPSPASLGSTLSGVNAIGDFFQRLTQKATWVRVGEVIAGGVILFIGVHALASGTPVSSAAKAVSKPVKKATHTATTVRKVAIPETAALKVPKRKTMPAKRVDKLARPRSKQFGG